MAGRKPDFRIFVSREGQDQEGNDKNYYQEIGVAWTADKGAISVHFQALPVEGKCVLFPYTERKKNEK